MGGKSPKQSRVPGAPGLDFETWDKQTTLSAPSMRPLLPHGWEITKAKPGAPGLESETWEGSRYMEKKQQEREM